MQPSMSEPLSQAEISAIAENIDALEWADCIRAATPAMREDLGIALLHAQDFVAGTVAKADVLALNRVVGLGVTQAADAEQVDALVAAYRAAGASRMMVQLTPDAEPHDLRARLEERGFKRHNAWMKLVRSCDVDVPTAETDLDIRILPPDRVQHLADIVANGFGWPDVLARWIAVIPGRRDWYFYGAFDDERLIGTGGMYVHESTAWLGFCATTPEGRRRGAQSALIERRLRDARELRCDWAVAETAEDLPHRPSPSYRNVRRFGFDLAYARPNYVLALRG